MDPRLQTAFELFLKELDKHIAFFAEVSAHLHALAAHAKKPEPITAQDVDLMKERFHLIRGGASFLGLTSIKESCEAAEALLKHEEPSHHEILRAINRITAEFETLRD